MIHENAPVTNTFVSISADLGQLNCAAFMAGIIAGVLDSARFVRLFFLDYSLSVNDTLLYYIHI
jgi:hypothetical protein